MRREGDTGAGGGVCGAGALGGESHSCHQGPAYITKVRREGATGEGGGDGSGAGARAGRVIRVIKALQTLHRVRREGEGEIHI